MLDAGPFVLAGITAGFVDGFGDRGDEAIEACGAVQYFVGPALFVLRCCVRDFCV
jgi:hypothetical protein